MTGSQSSQARNRSPEHPYWGTLESPSAASRHSGAKRVLADGTVNIPSHEPADAGPSRDKALPGTEAFHCAPKPRDPRRQEKVTPIRVKRFGVADPLAWDVINRSLAQQHRLSSLVGVDDAEAVPTKEPKESSQSSSDAVSRTSSQRKALDRFTRELERYADVAGAAGKAPITTPTISDAKASVHTVKPLVPYKDQFLAAGLAVTSTEQSRNGKGHAQAGAPRSRPHKHLNGPVRGREKPESPGDSTTSGKSTSTSCVSSRSYIEFAPPGGHIPHAIEPFVSRKASTKSKYCHHGRKRLISWFFNKPSCKEGSINANPLPVRTQQPKGGEINPNDLSSYQHQHQQPQSRSQRPEIRLRPKPDLPTKYISHKKGPDVVVSSNHYEQGDWGAHSELGGGHHHNMADAKRSLGEVGSRNKREIARGVLPKPRPEPIGTIGEEAEIHTHFMDNNNQANHLHPTSRDESPGVRGTQQRSDTTTLAIPKPSSPPALPLAAKLAASTASSLQQALDDACRKLDDEGPRADDGSKDTTKRELPPLPRDSREDNTPARKFRSAEKFIYVKRNMPTVDARQLASKPLPPRPLSLHPIMTEDYPETRPPEPSRQPPSPPDPPVPANNLKNAVAELTKAERMLKDLDMFLNDYDDAGIEDRDVIKGLQVAIHAAADDLYDGYIRYKTGLRIRRFLADLKSFEDISELDATNRQVRGKGKGKDTTNRRREDSGDQNNTRRE